MEADPIVIWSETPQGRYVLQWAQKRSEQAVTDVFGFHALQLGLCETDFLKTNRIPLHLALGSSTSAGVVCELSDLPIASQSVDLIMLPFMLETATEPHQILREIERVLRPEGLLVIIAFNPWSLWGIRRICRHLLAHLFVRPRQFPWDGHFYSVARLRDWLQLLGFEVERGAFGCYTLPCESRRNLDRLSFLEAAGDRWWSFAGGTYLLRAIKRVGGVRLIRPWKATRKSLRMLAAPVTGSLPSQKRGDRRC